MKRIILLFLLLYPITVSIGQNLVSYTEYYDYFKTRIKRTYTVFPNGNLHGKEKIFTEDGALYSTNTYNNNRRTSTTIFFKDGSIKINANIIYDLEMAGMWQYGDYVYSNYSLFHITDTGHRVLLQKLKLCKAPGIDSLTKFQKRIEFTPWDSVGLIFGDYRIESYQENYTDGLPMIRFSLSDNKRIEHLTHYDHDGHIIIDAVYDIKNELLTIKTLHKYHDFSFKDGILTYSNKDDIVKKDNGNEYRVLNKIIIPKGTIDIKISRRDFYDDIVSADYYKEDGAYLISINSLNWCLDIKPLLLDFLGRRLQWSAWDKNMCNINTLLQPIIEGNTGDGVYFANSPDERIEAIYKNAKLSHIDYINGSSFIRGDIENELLNGNGEYSWEGEYYKGAFKNNKKDGRGILKTKEYSYDGEFKNDKKDGRGILKTREYSYDGEFVDGNICGNGIKHINSNDITDESISIKEIGYFKTNHGKVGELYNGDIVIIRPSYTISYKVSYGEQYITMVSWINGDYFKPSEIIYLDKAVTPSLKHLKKGLIRISLKSGMIYEGEYCNGLNGKGKITLTNGNEFTGQFINNQLNKRAPINVKIKMNNGNIFKGSYIRNKISGHGMLITTNGKVYHGVWESGRLKNDSKIKLPIKKLSIPIIEFDVDDY